MRKAMQKLITNRTKVVDSQEDVPSLLTSIAATASPSKQWKRKPPTQLNLLTLRKKEKSLCEICNNYANFQCPSCKVTYYCSMEHLIIDEELHSDICAVMKVLRVPIAISTCQVTRQRMKSQYMLRVEEMIKFTYIKGRTAMINGQFDLAIAASCASLKTARKSYGDTFRTILPLTLLVECYLLKKKLHKAQRFLVECLRLELELDDVSTELQAAVRFVEGLVSLKAHQLSLARFCFAEQIYLYSECLNADHIKTASGYLNLGYIFMKKKRHIVAKSLIRRAVDIWSMYITSIVEKRIVESADILSTGQEVFTNVHRVQAYNQTAAKTQEFFQTLQFTCDRLDAASSVQSCYNMFRNLEPSMVTPSDYIEIDYAKAGLEFISNNLIDARNKYLDAVNKCMSHGLKETPIYQRLVRYRKLCTILIKASKKRGESPHYTRAPSRSDSGHSN